MYFNVIYIKTEFSEFDLLYGWIHTLAWCLVVIVCLQTDLFRRHVSDFRFTSQDLHSFKMGSTFKVNNLLRPRSCVTWADPDTHKPAGEKLAHHQRWFILSIIISITFAKHDEQVKLICILTFHKRYITFPSEKFRPETWLGKLMGKATQV